MKICLLILLVFSLSCYSQDSIPKKTPKWTMGAKLGAIRYDNVKAQNGFSHKYKVKTTIYFEANVGYQFSKRVSLSSGFFKTYLQFKADYVWIVSQPNDPAIPIKTDAEIRCLGIPLFMKFNVIAKEKIGVYVAPGVSYWVLHTGKGSTIYMNNEARKVNVNPSLYGAQLGAGISFAQDRYSWLTLEANYHVFSKGFDNIMYQSPTAFSVTLGLVGRVNYRCFFKKGAWRPLPLCD